MDTEDIRQLDTVPDDAVKIDRDTWFGNEFKLKRDGGEHTLDKSMALYREWFHDKLEDPEFRAAVEDHTSDT